MAGTTKKIRDLVEEKLGHEIPSYIRMNDQALEDIVAIHGSNEIDGIVSAIKQEMAVHESAQ